MRKSRSRRDQREAKSAHDFSSQKTVLQSLCKN